MQARRVRIAQPVPLDGEAGRDGARGARRTRDARRAGRPPRGRAASCACAAGRRSRPGATKFRPQASPQEILRQLAEGRVVLETLTVIEGWTFADMRRAIEAHPQIKVTLRGKDDRRAHERHRPRGRASGRALLPRHLSLRGGHHRSRSVRAGVSQDGRDARSGVERARRRAAARERLRSADARLDRREGNRARERTAADRRRVHRRACGETCGCRPIPP